MARDNYNTTCLHVYYAHILTSEKDPNIYLSIVHNKIDKSNTSIPRLVKKEKDISSVMNLPCNIPTIIPSLINVYVDIMCGYGPNDVICELYFYVLIIKCDVSC
jgi:hypothetical protein